MLVYRGNINVVYILSTVKTEHTYSFYDTLMMTAPVAFFEPHDDNYDTNGHHDDEQTYGGSS